MTTVSGGNTARSIVWFRAQIHDNPALVAGIARRRRTAGVRVRPMALSPRVWAPIACGFVGIVADLDASLRDVGSSLLVLHGAPRVVTRACKSWKVDLVTWEHDIEPYAKIRDRAVRGALERAGVECESHSGLRYAASANAGKVQG